LRNLQPLEFEQVRRTGKEPLFNSLMEEHHYLGYEQPVGEHLSDGAGIISHWKERSCSSTLGGLCVG
jgi:hypothetical protein